MVLDTPKSIILPSAKLGWLAVITGVLQSALNFARVLIFSTYKWLRILHREKVSIVHLNNSSGSDLDLILAARMLGLSVIAHQRGFPPEFGRMSYFGTKLIHRVIAVSDVVKDDLEERGVSPGKLIRIYDGIESGRLRNCPDPVVLRHSLGIDEGVPVVGMLGNIKWWKGQEVLIRSLPAVVESFPNLRCVFVGKVADNSYYNRMLELADSLGVARHIIFTGYRKDATELMDMMDVVVHASVEAEPFGLVVLEAMGRGRPVVAADLGGPKETVIPGDTGMLFRSGDHVDLAEKLVALIQDPGLRHRLGEAGIAHVKSRFTAEVNAKSIQAVYENVTKS
jgi:glycosyltransferase involved in cell wall biosynthesis